MDICLFKVLASPTTNKTAKKAVIIWATIFTMILLSE